MARKAGLISAMSGWGCFLLAMVCPAIDVAGRGLDSYPRHTEFGWFCLVQTLFPLSWAFAPLSLLYAGANLLMISSPIFVARTRLTRPIWGWLYLFCFCATLSVPWCENDLKVLFGAVLWSASFLQVGIGALLLPADWPRRAYAESWRHRPSGEIR